MSHLYSSENSLLLSLAKDAGQIIKEERENNSLSYNFKSHDELVTSSDIKADQFITSSIEQAFPEHKILSEESQSVLTPSLYEGGLWIIDPIDGTVNYAHHHTQVCVSIAFAYEGVVQCAAVMNPFTNELFHAVKGQGAYLNNQPIKVSSTNTLKSALIATGFPYQRDGLSKLLRQLQAILAHCSDIRRMGSAALDICWVACGRLDGYYETVKPWDCAAACLIAKEAGAMTGHFAPRVKDIPIDLYPDSLLIATPHIYNEMYDLLSQEA